MLRIWFFWTPRIAAQILADFIASDHVDVAFVVTGEDKPVGRGLEMRSNEVKNLALEHSIPCLQPAKIRGNTDFLDTIRSYDVDYFVVVAYGKILPTELLHLPRKNPESPEKRWSLSWKSSTGTSRTKMSTVSEEAEIWTQNSRFAEIPCINLHGSILPKYRGASPIQAALLAGEEKTGLTVMLMNEKMDEGDMIDILEIPIDRNETSGSLFEKFGELSGPFAINTIERLDRGELRPIPQDHTNATYCTKIEKEHGRLDFSKSAEELYHLYQGYTPWPGVFTEWNGKRLMIERCLPHPNPLISSPHPDPLHIMERENQSPLSTSGEGLGVRTGTIIRLADKTIGIVCGKWILTLERVKLEWKKSQPIGEFVNGHQDFISSVL